MNIQTALTSAIVMACMVTFGQDNSVEKRLDSLFTSLAAQNQFSGSVLIAEKGTIVYKGGKGYRNELTRELNNPQTIFELASCSKQFTGVAVALLHREKKLNYTDDITRYLPELEKFKGVSIADLLHHTSGIPEFLYGSFTEAWKNERIATPEDVVAYYAQGKDTLQFVPGSTERYTNTNYVLLAVIIERVSGQKLETYLSDKIFRPLKMKHTFIYCRRVAPRKLKNYAFGYVWIKHSFEKAAEDDERVGNLVTRYMDGVYGAAKVHSTVEDLYKWMNAIKNNQLLTAQELEEVMAYGKTSAGKEVKYGFGFEVRKGNSSIAYGHTGSWDGYSTLMHYSSKTDRTVIVLNNFKNGVCPYQTIIEILDHQPSLNEFVKKVDQPEEVIKHYAGEYTDLGNPDEKHLVTYLNGHLVYNTDKIDWDMRFFPSSGNVFQAIRQGGANGVMEFQVQEDGSIKLELSEYGNVIGQGIKK